MFKHAFQVWGGEEREERSKWRENRMSVNIVIIGDTDFVLNTTD